MNKKKFTKLQMIKDKKKKKKKTFEVTSSQE